MEELEIGEWRMEIEGWRLEEKKKRKRKRKKIGEKEEGRRGESTYST